MNQMNIWIIIIADKLIFNNFKEIYNNLFQKIKINEVVLHE